LSTPLGIRQGEGLAASANGEGAITRGGRVVIGTQDPEALGAVHDYLEYQIREHKTGDSLEVK